MATVPIQTGLLPSDASTFTELMTHYGLNRYNMGQKLLLQGMEMETSRGSSLSRRPALRRRSALADRIDALIEQAEDLAARQQDYDPDFVGTELGRLMRGVLGASYVLPLTYGHRTETLATLVYDFAVWLISMDRPDEVRDIANAIAQSAKAALAGQEA